jgi:hypothetical protein
MNATTTCCATTVPEFDVFNLLRLTPSEKQIPQAIENAENWNQRMEELEPMAALS